MSTRSSRPSVYPRADVLAPVLLVLLVALGYAGSLRGGFLRIDDLQVLGYARSHSPLSGFLNDLGAHIFYASDYYRPLFVLQVGVLSRLFGLNYAAFQGALLLAHAGATVALYAALRRAGVGPLAAALPAAVFAGHRFVRPLVIWVSDAAVWTSLAAALALLIVLRPRPGWRWPLALWALVLFAALSRENGLAVGAAVGAVALASFLPRADLPLARAHAWRALLAVALAVVAYAALRTAAIGLLPDGFSSEEVCLLSTRYTPAQMAAFALPKRLALAAYTVAINLLTSFAPVVKGPGCTWTAANYTAVLSLALLAGGVTVAAHWPEWPRAARGWLAGGLGFAAAAALALWAASNLDSPLRPGQLSALAEMSSGGLQAALSAGIVAAALAHRTALDARQRAAAVFALALIVASSLLAFTYYRDRNLALAALGWVVLLGLAISALRAAPRPRALRAALLGVAAVLVALNTALLLTSLLLPSLDPTRASSLTALCDPSVPPALAEDLAARYGLPAEDLAACRAERSRP